MIASDYFEEFDSTNGRPGPVALGVEYKGTHYHGWQAQEPGVASVQETLERALAKVADHSVRVVCSGRTDTGVHACNQVVHFDTTVTRSDKAWVFGTNCNLPSDIRVRWATPVSDEFHARFSARARHYRYVICNHRLRPALMGDQLSWCSHPLDTQRMQQAAQYLIGEHDFSSFRAAGCQSKTPMRNVHFINVTGRGPLVIIDVKANAFLHHMIRNLAGVLMRIGRGDAEPEWAQEVLEARDRTLAAETAPPHGLYFVDAEYPETFALPQEPLGPHFVDAILS